MVDDLVEIFRKACIATGLCHHIDTVSGTTTVTPRVEFIDLRDPLTLSVRLLPGQLPDDFLGAGRRIARALGGFMLRVQPRGTSHAILTVLPDDPLAEPFSGIPESGPILIGRDEQGQDISLAYDTIPHTLVCGATGSGKSSFAYSLIAQLSTRLGPIRITGIDASGTTLRPFPDAVNGLANLQAADDLLQRLTTDLDRRLTEIPADRDLLPVSERNPATFVVLEEWGAVLRAAESADKRLSARIRTAVARLLCEARKTRISVVMLVQRPEANLIGGTERSQMGLRIAFRLDGPDSVKMAVPEAADYAAEHASALPGVALAAVPGRGLVRLRAPFLGYSDYTRLVAR